MIEVKIIKENPSSFIVQGNRIDRQVKTPKGHTYPVHATARVPKSKAVDVEIVNKGKDEVAVSCKIPRWLYNQVVIDLPEVDF